MFASFKKSRKEAAAATIVRYDFGIETSPLMRRAMYDLFGGIIDRGGNEYDAAIIHITNMIRMLVEGPSPEAGLGSGLISATRR